TFEPDEVADAVPPGPGLIDVAVPPGPADELPLSVLALSPAADGSYGREVDEPLAVGPAFSVRHGCRLSTMIVVPPLLPLTIETFAPPAEVELVVSATASVVAPATTPMARNRPDRAMRARMVHLS